MCLIREEGYYRNSPDKENIVRFLILVECMWDEKESIEKCLH